MYYPQFELEVLADISTIRRLLFADLKPFVNFLKVKELKKLTLFDSSESLELIHSVTSAEHRLGIRRASMLCS